MTKRPAWAAGRSGDELLAEFPNRITTKFPAATPPLPGHPIVSRVWWWWP